MFDLTFPQTGIHIRRSAALTGRWYRESFSLPDKWKRLKGKASSAVPMQISPVIPQLWVTCPSASLLVSGAFWKHLHFRRVNIQRVVVAPYKIRESWNELLPGILPLICIRGCWALVWERGKVRKKVAGLESVVLHFVDLLNGYVVVVVNFSHL